ncbi:MAG: TGS domain-containing protein [Proteobacteria bacterium]|nr:TGS domain-containing protein [Pseudomonadota bacterium]
MKTSYQHRLGALRSLDRDFQDDGLSRAGFLCGLSRELRDRLLDVATSFAGADEIITIVEELGHFVALKPEGVEITRCLEQIVGSGVCDARTVALFMADRMERVDPDGHLRAWTETFRHWYPLSNRQSPRMNEMLDPAEILHAEKVLLSVAEFFGFWTERNALRNLILHAHNPAKFTALVQFATECSSRDGPCARHVSAVRDVLEQAGAGSYQIRWEWRHVASLADVANLHIPAAEQWQTQHRWGYVTIECRDPLSCYAVLAHLHRAFAHRPRAIRDTLGQGTVAGYRALHTILTNTDAKLVVSVRLVPDSHRQPDGKAQLERIQRMLDIRRADHICVYTPKGEEKKLPARATVLHFAHAIHSDYVTRVDHIIVNGERTDDILRYLRNGDRVELHLRDEPHPLPEGWEKHFSASKARSIVYAQRRALGKKFEKAGRIWLQEQLLTGVRLEINDNHLMDILVEDAARYIASGPNRPRDDLEEPEAPGELEEPEERKERKERKEPGWWLRQLGMLASAGREPYRGMEPGISPDTASLLVRRITKNVRSIRPRVLKIDEIEIKPEHRSRADMVVKCPICEPTPEHRIGITVKDNRLTVHRYGLDCARNATLVNRQRKIAVQQYFLIETRRIVGGWADILDVFRNQGADGYECVARRLGVDWGLIRVSVDHLGYECTSRILTELRDLPGVTRVWDPSEKNPTGLESYLPGRDDWRAEHWMPIPSPYLVGPAVESDNHFYGRAGEIVTLDEHLQATREPSAQMGRMIWVQGPKKIGKTSLVLKFQRYLDKEIATPYIHVYFRLNPGHTVQDLIRGVRERLLESAGKTARRFGVTSPSIGDCSLAETIRTILALPTNPRPAIVLLIDEAIPFFYEVAHRDEKSQPLQELADFVGQTARLFIVWVGPTAVTRWLNPEMQPILRASHPVPVAGLDFRSATALLQAEHQEPMCTIRIRLREMRDVYRLTAGNPHWIAYIGNEMWSLCKRDGELTEYKSRHLKEAKSHLFTTGVAFSYHTFHAGNEYLKPISSHSAPGPWLAAMAWNILTFMASSSDCAVVTSQALHSGTRSTAKNNWNQELFHEALIQLQARGSVVRQIDGWALSAPILAEYIRFINRDDTGRHTFHEHG